MLQPSMSAKRAFFIVVLVLFLGLVIIRFVCDFTLFPPSYEA